jgi:hypothetical protein
MAHKEIALMDTKQASRKIDSVKHDQTRQKSAAKRRAKAQERRVWRNWLDQPWPGGVMPFEVEATVAAGLRAGMTWASLRDQLGFADDDFRRAIFYFAERRRLQLRFSALKRRAEPTVRTDDRVATWIVHHYGLTTPINPIALAERMGLRVVFANSSCSVDVIDNELLLVGKSHRSNIALLQTLAVANQIACGCALAVIRRLGVEHATEDWILATGVASRLMNADWQPVLRRVEGSSDPSLRTPARGILRLLASNDNAEKVRRRA